MTMEGARRRYAEGGRGRQGTKMTTITDHNGITTSVHLTGANIPDCVLLETSLLQCNNRMGGPSTRAGRTARARVYEFTLTG